MKIQNLMDVKSVRGHSVIEKNQEYDNLFRVHFYP